MLVFLLMVAGADAWRTCRALTLEGGGSHGAFEAGAIYAMTQELPESETQWDIVTGISTGALNSGLVGVWPKEQPKEMGEFVYNVWNNFTHDSQIYVPWKEGSALAFVMKPSLYDNHPVVDLMRNLLSRGFHRHVSVGATNLNTGDFVNFDESLGTEDMTEAILCSASPPLYFPPRYFRNAWYADGGCKSNADIFEAIHRCRKMVWSDRFITVDVILDYMNPKISVADNLNTYQILQLVNQIKNFDSVTWMYQNACIAFPNVNFRYYVEPTEPIPGGYVPLDFTPDTTQFTLNLGKKDGSNAIKEGRKLCDVFGPTLQSSQVLYAED